MGFFSLPKNSVPSISVADFLAMRGKKEPFILIDVRDQSEWNAGHIEEAKLVPLVVLGFKIGEVVPDKQTPIIVHCMSGGRSSVGTQMLLKLGYANVKNLEGGYLAYQSAKNR